MRRNHRFVTGREGWVIALVAIAGYLPFINKPLTIDADMLVHTARQMAMDPVNPPLGDYGRLMALHDHTKMPPGSVYFRTGHPPLLPLLLVPVVANTGSREWPLHLFFFVFYAAAIVAVWHLLGLFYPFPFRFWGTLLWTVSPALLVNASNIMWDVPITAFMLGSFVLFLRGTRDDDLRMLLLSGIVAGLGALTKVNILPLFILFPLFLAATRRWKALLVWSIPAAAFPLLWVAHNLVVFGQVHYLSVGWYSFLFGDIRYRMERNVAYFGAALMLPVFWLWLMVATRQWKAPAVCALAGGAWGVLLVVVLGKAVWFGALYALSAAAGLWVLYRCLSFFGGRKQGTFLLHEPLLVSLFALLYLVVLNIMPSASVRYILPMVPLGLLVVGEELGALSRRHRRWWLGTALCAGALISPGLAAGDYLQGSADRALPCTLAARGYAPATTWYYGRLSYAWYLHHAGYRNLRGDTLRPRDGDALVNEEIPGDYDAREMLRSGYLLEPVDTIDAPSWPLRVRGFGAGFYGNDRLPWSVSLAAPQKRYLVYRISRAPASP
ncbi:MAG: glycosyltransferase family 39 protein [Chitinispirillaceae bacterium]|nr:glycosyltransferase family 39 protein [Chitinispirillaceae bacterium]